MTARCICHRCIKEHDLHVAVVILGQPQKIPLSATQMILCPTCGNKRCPHASDHRLACTNSNESGQPGSIYPKPITGPCGQCKSYKVPCPCSSPPLMKEEE